MTKIAGLNEYQQRALETWLSHSTENNYNIIYPTLGLVGESGEVAEKSRNYFATTMVCLMMKCAMLLRWKFLMWLGIWQHFHTNLDSLYKKSQR